MINDLVSVIIPVYNRENLITDTVNSVLNQSYSNIECIIVDDRSSDNTFSILNDLSRKDPRIKVLKRPYFLKKGANSCRNYGFKFSNGEFITWFDSDDIMTYNSILSRLFLLKTLDLDFIIGRINNFIFSPLENFNQKKTILVPTSNNPACEYLIGNFWFHTSSPLFKRVYLKKFKKHFDRDISFHDEGEFFIRLLLKSPKISYTENIVTLRRMHNISVSYVYNSDFESEKLLKDHYGSLKIWLSFKKSNLFYNDELQLFFKYYFKRWILKMKLNSLRLIWILYLGIKYNMFDDNLKFTKIVCWRILKSK
jgi:glycosyltransferase involved in cell wall biosynthesis